MVHCYNYYFSYRSPSSFQQRFLLTYRRSQVYFLKLHSGQDDANNPYIFDIFNNVSLKKKN